MKARRFMTLGAVILALGMLGVGCSPLVDESEAPNRLVVLEITTTNVSGATGVLQSDVVTIVDTDAGPVATVFEDVAGVTFRNTWFAFGVTPTDLNDLVVTRYRVTYQRSDGRNQPGKDVPFPFDGTLNVHVPVNDVGTGQFTLVRAQAKLEEPLFSLRNGGAEGELSVTAFIEFWAHDLIGRGVRTTATYPIHFADWADQ